MGDDQPGVGTIGRNRSGSMPPKSAPVSAAIGVWLGIVLEDDGNAPYQTPISSASCAVSVFVVPTDENLMIARHMRSVLERRFSSVKQAKAAETLRPFAHFWPRSQLALRP
jgi:hypothetical protein